MTFLDEASCFVRHMDVRVIFSEFDRESHWIKKNEGKFGINDNFNYCSILVGQNAIGQQACARHIAFPFNRIIRVENSWATEIQPNYRVNLRNRRMRVCVLRSAQNMSAPRRLCESNEFIGWGKNNKHHQTSANTIHGISFSPFSIHTFVFQYCFFFFSSPFSYCIHSIPIASRLDWWFLFCAHLHWIRLSERGRRRRKKKPKLEKRNKSSARIPQWTRTVFVKRDDPVNWKIRHYLGALRRRVKFIIRTINFA